MKKTKKMMMLLFVLYIGMYSTGCQSIKSDVYKTTWKQDMSQCVEALQNGNLDEAESILELSQNRATTFERKRQHDSLKHLIAGSRAMTDGNVVEAREHWAQIEDPALSFQVRKQVEIVMGIDVPMVAENE
ncbi:MAG: hypothetical protein JEZ07_14380 [Phycisphaerae bacterium]|nr:hypothetical protein [Phycisphaerae bacterium]